MMVEKTISQSKQDNTIKPNKHTINPARLDRITTISATNHVGHDHIGHRRNRPQPIPYRPQAKPISATDNFNE